MSNILNEYSETRNYSYLNEREEDRIPNWSERCIVESRNFIYRSFFFLPANSGYILFFVRFVFVVFSWYFLCFFSLVVVLQPDINWCGLWIIILYLS